jgi:hypothetical protein
MPPRATVSSSSYPPIILPATDSSSSKSPSAEAFNAVRTRHLGQSPRGAFAGKGCWQRGQAGEPVMAKAKSANNHRACRSRSSIHPQTNPRGRPKNRGQARAGSTRRTIVRALQSAANLGRGFPTDPRRFSARIKQNHGDAHPPKSRRLRHMLFLEASGAVQRLNPADRSARDTPWSVEGTKEKGLGRRDSVV